MAMERLATTASSEDMDMTPMVDVTFLLLIFFMITASFALQRSFQVPVPENDQVSRNATVDEMFEDPDYVIVRVDRFNTFHVRSAVWDTEEEAPNKFDLLIKLRKACASGASQGSRRMLICADGRSTYEYVVQAMDAGNEVGIETLNLLTLDEDP